MASGTEIIRGFEWFVEKPYYEYIAVCDKLHLTACGDTWEELMESIDDICDDLIEEFGSLEKYCKVIERNSVL